MEGQKGLNYHIEVEFFVSPFWSQIVLKTRNRKIKKTFSLCFITLVAFGCGTKEIPPELTRAKQLFAEFNCATNDAQWSNFMQTDKGRAQEVIRMFEENGMNTSTKSIDWVVGNYLAAFKESCNNSNDAVQHRINETMQDRSKQ